MQAAAAHADSFADAWGLSPRPPTPVDDDQAVGLRRAHERHLPDITVAALRPCQ
ncbi:hypothetical protein ACF1BE_29405 [Streptomyces sp. NPDC014991]|uniref:hypothetical protein n=1 Tax=Streptomyces sp. NPDC014991 TaxID=3364935 RepID=UPI0036FE708B